jgi:predicted DNA-binding transcriptional regulator AlpA
MTAELLRQPEAAEYLGVSTRYLRYRSDIPVVLLPGHGEKGRPLLRYRRRDLDTWIERVNNPRSRKPA